MSRTILTAPETFTPSATYPTLQALWDYVMANYDLASQPITFTGFSNPMTAPFSANGLFVGQTGWQQVTILGDPTAPTNAQIITSGTDPMTFSNGASAWVRGWYLEGTNVANGLLTLNSGAKVILGKIGDAGIMVFGPILGTANSSMNDMSIAGASQLGILDGTPSAPGSVIACNLGSYGGTGLVKQCMVDIAQNSIFSVNTNGQPSLLDWDLEGTCTYGSGIFRADEGSSITLGCNFTGPVTHGEQYWLNGYSTLVDYNPPSGLPGDVAGVANAPYGQYRHT